MKKISVIISIVLLLTGCIPDERNNFMVPDSFGITSLENVVEASVHTGSYRIGISKSGKGQTAAQVHISQNADECKAVVDRYNQENNTHFRPIQPSLYTLDATDFSFAEKDVTREVGLHWDPFLVASFMGESEDYVLPILIESDDETVKVQEKRSYILVHLNRSAVAVKQQNVARTIERKSVEPGSDGSQPELQEVITLDVGITPAIRQVGLRFPVAIDLSDAPEGLVTPLDAEAVIEEGKLSGSFRIQLDKSVLLKDGAYQDFPPYEITVRVKTEGLQATLAGEPFQLKGLSYGNMVTKVVVEPAAKGIKDIQRVWGLFSTDGAWYNFLDGFSASADRTVAMDDELVYISRSSKQGGIYALSLSSGAFVKQLDVTPALATDCTLTVSCVRSISNPGGKNVLTFCTLKEDASQHLFVYAYVNGTDAAPVQILDYALDNKGGVEDWRRYGDRYTVEGNWKSGKLWFQTWHDGGTAKTIGFTIENGVITNPQDPIDYYVANPPAGIKDVAFYPGSSQAFITGPGKATLYKPGSAGPNGWIKWDVVEELEDLQFSYGYNFFTFHDSRFIAYMKLDGENAVRGRLVVIDDEAGTAAGLTSQLKSQTNLREFPLQHADDFEAKSSITASHSVGDCIVFENKGNTYIAVLMQGCGLSLFQLQ